MLLGLGKPKPVPEHEAEGEVERVYHEIRQTLRVTGVNLNFRTWAAYGKFLPAMWDAVRPNAETRAFENAADQVRMRAVLAADKLGRLGVPAAVRLGDSQAFQIRAALDLYHYVNPKLLVLTSAVRLALDGEPVGPDATGGGGTGSERTGSGQPAPAGEGEPSRQRSGGTGERDETGAGGAAPEGAATGQGAADELGGGARLELLERGAPGSMYPMEMVDEDPADPRLRAVFRDIRETLSLESINSDYRTLALWPDYLANAWVRLKPTVVEDDYRRAGNELRESARALARRLPHPVPLSRRLVEDLGVDADEVTERTASFERLLPPLILNVALLALDWRAPDHLAASPFPAASRRRSSRPPARSPGPAGGRPHEDAEDRS